MFSERVYRRLLVVYPKEHREEYGELMVQLFRDRMRRDGDGFRVPIVWMQMIFDLAGAAFKEHKERKEYKMKKRIGRIGIGVVLVAAVLMGVVGASTLLAQSQVKKVVSVSVQEAEPSVSVFLQRPDGVAIEEPDSAPNISVSGADALTDAMRQAVEEGAIDQEAADEVVQVFNEWRAGSSAEEAGEIVKVSVRYDSSPTFSLEVAEGVDAALLADAVRQAVEEGLIAQEMADQILQSLDDENVQKKAYAPNW